MKRNSSNGRGSTVKRGVSRAYLISLGLFACVGSVPIVWRYYHPVVVKMSGAKTVEDRVRQYGPAARERLAPHFERAKVAYPPGYVTLVGLKHEKTLRLFAGLSRERQVFVREYPILGASGKLGPKLREGDRQVPEGLYRIESLNPNSRYHLSLRVNYPNAFDKEMARRDGRTNLGSDIMIHGNTGSIGCLAMGDPVSEELFVLADDVGIKNFDVVLSPLDLCREKMPAGLDSLPSWTKDLYAQIERELRRLRP